MTGGPPEGLTREEWASLAQGSAEHLAYVLQGLLGQSYDEFDDLAINEDGTITITAQQAWAMAQTLAAVLPRCFSIMHGRSAQCQIPDGVCYQCASEGRSVPTSHPLRKGEDT